MDRDALMLPAATMPPTEHRTLAQELARDYMAQVEAYRAHGASLEEAHGRTSQGLSPAERLRALKGRPSELSWSDLRRLGQESPELVLERWEEMKQTARDEIRNGHRAAQVVEWGGANGPWERARYMALREELASGWQPQNGLEWALVDGMAQALTAKEAWMNRAIGRSALDARVEREERNATGSWSRPKLEEAEAQNQAAAMVDRFDRVFLRALRQLRDLRRYAPSITINNPGQVNIGSQQVNMARTDGASPEE